jgi:hypothetical protein
MEKYGQYRDKGMKSPAWSFRYFPLLIIILLQALASRLSSLCQTLVEMLHYCSHGGWYVMF